MLFDLLPTAKLTIVKSHFRVDIFFLVVPVIILLFPWWSSLFASLLVDPFAVGHVFDNAENAGMTFTDFAGFVGSNFVLSSFQLHYVKCILDIHKPLSRVSRQFAILGIVSFIP